MSVRATIAVLVATVLLLGACSSDTDTSAVENAASGDTNTTDTSIAPDDSAPATSGDSPDIAEPTGDEAPETSPGEAVAEPSGDVDADFPDIIAARATREDAGTWRFDVTVSSPYDTPERYADAWRVLGPDGTEFGVRILTHDHANEQPFTRSQGGIDIPDEVTAVTIEGRDLANGWGGGTLEVELP